MSKESTNTRVSVSEQDFLDQDTPIRGQKYVCLSFISPESVIQRKDTFVLSRFLDHFSGEMQELFVSMMEKFKDEPDTIDMLERIRERHDYIFDGKALDDQLKVFTEQNADNLETQFAEANQFRTSVRGIKVRGSYETLPEAQRRAEAIKKKDQYCDTYIAEVGCWCPWDPSPHQVDEEVHAETELNTLMKKYKENVDEGKVLYEQRRKDLTEKSKAHAKREASKTEHDKEEAVAGTSAEFPAEVVVLPGDAPDPWMANKTAQEEKD
jgi:hypothetical protein